MRDIVYILKNDIQPDELRYSLRSVCENFPHRNIVFVGGCPEGISCDVYIPHQQIGVTKWERSTSSLKKACETESLTDEIFLFNDDFYVLQKQDTDNFINYTNGTIGRRIKELEKNVGRHSTYSRRLKNMEITLKGQGYDSISFAVHMPMLINRHNALEIISKNPSCPMFRSLYGNICRIPYTFHEDVKIYTNHEVPMYDDYLSTTEKSFAEGLVGEYIRKRFPHPCKYEYIKPIYTHELYTEDGDERYIAEPLEERR